MTSKPPVQKPPVRTPSPPAVPGIPGGFAAPPPVYVPPSPVYMPPPPPEGAPMTGFLSMLGWVSVIWLVGILVLGLLLRWASYGGYGASVAYVSMWCSIAMGVIGGLSGLLAIFELGREPTGDAPKPTMPRLLAAFGLLAFGVVGQVLFSNYLTASDAGTLQARLSGVWERVGDAPASGAWDSYTKGGFSGEMKSTTDGSASGGLSSAPTDTLDFTQPGVVIHERFSPSSQELTGEQDSIRMNGAASFTVMQGGFRDYEIEVEFVTEDEIILKLSSWYNNTTLTGRWRRISGGTGAVTGSFAEMLPRLRGQLRGFHIQKRKLASLLAKLDQQRASLVGQLREKGVRTAEDLQGASAAAKQLSQELVSLARQIKKVQAKHDDCETSIVKIESALRQVDVQVDLQQADVEDLQQVTDLLAQLGVRLEEGSGNAAIDAINDQKLLEEQLGP